MLARANKICKKIYRKLKKWTKKLYKRARKKGIRSAYRLLKTCVWWRLIGKRQVEFEMRHPPKVQDNKIVFESYGDYGDNARALSDYLVSCGLDEKYEIVWVVDNPVQYAQIAPSSIRFVKRKYSNGRITLEALREIHSAKYVFYTVNVNWARIAQKEQIFVNLWHGCSFKANKAERKVFFDYLLIPSIFFLEAKETFFGCSADKLLPIGYPRYDLMLKGDERTAQYVRFQLESHAVEKVILWMPTYRKSKSKRLNEDTLDMSEFNLPIIYNEDDLRHLNEACAKNDILIIIKQHRLHKMHRIDTAEYDHLRFLKDRDLEKENIQLYNLLHEADAMITDYSSVGVDYLLLDRPIAYTLDDYQAYKDSRGFTIDNPLDYMPGNHVYTVDDFLQFIDEVGTGSDRYKMRREEVTMQLHISCDSYCQKLLDFLEIR